jgi:hypothetical protein
VTRVGGIGDTEKFADPRFFAEDRCPAGYADDLRYLYWLPFSLSIPIPVPQDAKTRIGLIRKKVQDAATAGVGGKGVQSIFEASHDTLVKTASYIADQYDAIARGALTEKQIANFADELGTTSVALKISAPGILAQLSGSAKDLIGDPNAQSVWNAIGPQIMREFQVVIDKVRSITSASDAISSSSDLTAVIPIFGLMFKIAVEQMSAYQQSKNEDWQKFCADLIETEIVQPLKRTSAQGFPFPWHALDFSLDCPTPGSMTAESWHPTASQDAAAYAVKTNFRRLNELDPIADVGLIAPMRRWWALALQLMSYGDVAPIFRALGNDAQGGLWASDEQVVLVAAPIAAAYGLPIWEFAEALWNRSNGWRDGGYRLRPEPIRSWVGDLDSDAHAVTYCAIAPANAMQIQWGVLARDAFALAEETKAGKSSSPLSPIFMVTPAGLAPVAAFPATPTITQPKKSRLPLWLGGAASGVAYLASAPLWFVATPIALGLYFTFRKPKSPPPKEPPPKEPPPREKHEGSVVSPVAKEFLSSRMELIGGFR